MSSILKPASKVFLDTIPFVHTGRTAALGYFDGIHIGHQEIIRKAVRSAKLAGIPSLLQTFTGFSKCAGRCLTTTEEKLEILTDMGVDEMLVIDFTEDFRNLTPKQFCDNVIRSCINAAGVFVGDDYRFGCKAEGDVAFLEEYGARHGIGIRVFPEKRLEGSERRVSSSWMREALENGDASLYMKLSGGRAFSYQGRVVRGKQLGRQLGFPTANILIPEDKFIVRRGVYVSRVIIGREVYGAVTNVGLRPTVDDSPADTVETFIFDFDEDIYGAQIKVELLEFLRPETRFPGREALIEAVERNKIQAKTYLEQSGIICE